VIGARFHQRLRRELQLDNNAVCQSKLTLASLASLRMTQIVFNYQLLFGYLEALNIRTRAELQAVLQTFVAMAIYTIVEVPAPNSSPTIAQWYSPQTTPFAVSLCQL
jgi:hypothetical protein